MKTAIFSRSWIMSKRINICSNFFSPSGSHTIVVYRSYTDTKHRAASLRQQRFLSWNHMTEDLPCARSKSHFSFLLHRSHYVTSCPSRLPSVPCRICLSLRKKDNIVISNLAPSSSIGLLYSLSHSTADNDTFIGLFVHYVFQLCAFPMARSVRKKLRCLKMQQRKTSHDRSRSLFGVSRHCTSCCWSCRKTKGLFCHANKIIRQTGRYCLLMFVLAECYYVTFRYCHGNSVCLSVTLIFFAIGLFCTIL